MAAENSGITRPVKDTPGQMDLALAREFLEVTRKDFELRSQELALKKDGQVHAHEYALQSLATMATDRVGGRAHRRSEMRQYLTFATVLVVLILTFATVALFLNQSAIVIEGLKIVGTFVGGAGAGAFFGYRKGQKEVARSESDVEDEE